jgi:hypothetical protein
LGLLYCAHNHHGDRVPHCADASTAHSAAAAAAAAGAAAAASAIAAYATKRRREVTGLDRGAHRGRPLGAARVEGKAVRALVLEGREQLHRREQRKQVGAASAAVGNAVAAGSAASRLGSDHLGDRVEHVAHDRRLEAVEELGQAREGLGGRAVSRHLRRASRQPRQREFSRRELT